MPRPERRHDAVQFIGYALSTVPAATTPIGDPNGPGFVSGTYLGLRDPIADISARTAVITSAVEQAAADPAVEGPTALKVFMVPEFAYRGRAGAYDGSDEVDHFEVTRRVVVARLAARGYDDWLFVLGTIVCTTEDYSPDGDDPLAVEARAREELAAAIGTVWSAASRNRNEALARLAFGLLDHFTAYCHDHPLYVVTNRCYVLEGRSDPTFPDGRSVTKKYISNEDFVLNLYSGIFAEEGVAYPYVDTVAGDVKLSPLDDLAVFTIDGVRFGIEICLDHANHRLRRHLELTGPVDVQLVPSCGMQLRQASIAAVEGGLVFNCDGQYGTPRQDVEPGAGTSRWTPAGAAHTQLAAVVRPPGPFDPSDPRAARAGVAAPGCPVAVRSVRGVDTASLWSHGPGELHIYGPVPLPG